MKLPDILRYLRCDHKLQETQIYSGNEENFTKNGATLLEERISLFNGRTNSIRCFSVDDLNSMIVDKDQITKRSASYRSLRGVWDGKLVQLKTVGGGERSNEFACREIAVATEMSTHRNVHRLVGCYLHTKNPILVYEWEEKGPLESRIIINDESKDTLEWKDRLRIAWEIAHAVAYLHTAFDRPIVHRDLIPVNVFLDKDDSVRLSDFSLCISIPAGEKHVEDSVRGTLGYIAPEYYASCRVAESSDVFAFGVILLVLLTGKTPFTFYRLSNQGGVSFSKWLSEPFSANYLDDVDPTITRNGPIADEVHLKAIVDLAISCLAKDGECRPTMVDVATQLKDITISASDSL